MGLEKPKLQIAKLQIRRKLYRGQNGWLLCGRDQQGRLVSIFTTLHESAERMKKNIKMGREANDDGA